MAFFLGTLGVEEIYERTQSMPEPSARELEHMTLASLQRAAGYDIEGSRERVVPAYLWAARGGLIALAGVAVVAHAKMKKKQRR